MDKEFSGYDKDGNPIYWDPRPRVISLGNGKYAFKWIGHAGQELELIYLRPDAVEVIVEAAATFSEAAGFTYRFKVRNTTASENSVGGFEFQRFSRDLRTVTDGLTYATPASLLAEPYPPEGGWMRFAPLNVGNAIKPGNSAIYVLRSPDLPGLLSCRVHAGNLTMEGVGEEPPAGFESLMLRRDAWPHGYTIGPDDRLAKMGLQGRLNYLGMRLPQMLELGWIENERVMQWYKENLLSGKTAEVRARAEADFKRNLITSEVLALMTYLTK
jgi:hypothetical protein